MTILSLMISNIVLIEWGKNCFDKNGLAFHPGPVLQGQMAWQWNYIFFKKRGGRMLDLNQGSLGLQRSMLTT